MAEDKTGPAVADFVAVMLKVFIKVPDTESVFKLIEDYPWLCNAEWLKTPQLGKQVAASILKHSNNYDKKLKQTQMCMGAALTVSTRVLQGLMEKANEDVSLLLLGWQAVDALTLGAYVHSDLNTIRKGAIRQVVNPSYAGVFTRRTVPSQESLLVESSVPNQIKEYDEINKVKAKLQKNKKTQDNNRMIRSGVGAGASPRRIGEVTLIAAKTMAVSLITARTKTRVFTREAVEVAADN